MDITGHSAIDVALDEFLNPRVPADSGGKPGVQGWLKQSLQRRSLDEIIDQMQAEAKVNGLTQAILDEVVRGDDEFTFRPNND